MNKKHAVFVVAVVLVACGVMVGLRAMSESETPAFQSFKSIISDINSGDQGKLSAAVVSFIDKGDDLMNDAQVQKWLEDKKNLETAMKAFGRVLYDLLVNKKSPDAALGFILSTKLALEVVEPFITELIKSNPEVLNYKFEKDGDFKGLNAQQAIEKMKKIKQEAIEELVYKAIERKIKEQQKTVDNLASALQALGQ